MEKLCLFFKSRIINWKKVINAKKIIAILLKVMMENNKNKNLQLEIK